MMDYKNISRNQQPRMDASGRESWGARRHGRCGVRLAPRSGRKETNNEFGGTPKAAVGQSEQHKSGPLSGLTALPMNRISKHSRLFESIRGCTRNSLIFRKGLMQVVDFHDSFTYFSHGLTLGERDRLAAPKRSNVRPGRRWVRLTPRFGRKGKTGDIY